MKEDRGASAKASVRSSAAAQPASRVAIVCGGRDYENATECFGFLDALHQMHPFRLILQGGATGADRLAKRWAMARGIASREYTADWRAHGKAAGPIRNQMMLDYGPDAVIAFPGGAGTEDMMRRARAAGVAVIELKRSSFSLADCNDSEDRTEAEGEAHNV